jgi:serine/threonine protein kinase
MTPDGTRSDTQLWSHPLGRVFFTEFAADSSQWMRAVLRSPLGLNAAAVQTCRRDNRVASTLGCPALLGALSVTPRHKGRLELVTPYTPALSLIDVIAEGALPAARAIGILRQLCHAITALHRAGMIHGALTAASVLLTLDGGRTDAIRLTDLGLGALLTPATMGDEAIAQQPLSPEKILGLPRDHREDVYLVGALGYAMFAGKPPFFAEDAAEVRRRHAIEDAPRLRATLSDLPPAIDAVIRRCLAKDVEERYASLAQLDSALARAAQRSGIVTSWDDLPELPHVDLRPLRTADESTTRGERMAIPHPVRTAPTFEIDLEEEIVKVESTEAPTHSRTGSRRRRLHTYGFLTALVVTVTLMSVPGPWHPTEWSGAAWIESSWQRLLGDADEAPAREP